MATKAWGTYLGSDLIGTDVRHSLPISPMSEPSRATTSDDCGGWMRRQGSVPSDSCAMSGGAASAATRSARSTRREVITGERFMAQKNTPKGPEWYQAVRATVCD